MTIDSSWLRVFKEHAPHAFTETCPVRPKVVYIDGMPSLMVAENRVSQWGDYVRTNFAMSIQRFFRLGCEVVVLAFDEYDHVPAAKSITQTNRAKAKARYEFGEGQNLPPTMPQGFNDKLANRAFKRKVLDMICNNISQHMSGLMPSATTDRALIIDYSSCPIRFCMPQGMTGAQLASVKPEFMTGLPPMGEADVKFLRWAELFRGDILAHSVDGDFIPISLIRHEQNMLATKEEEPLGYRIILHRLKYKMPSSAQPAEGSGKKGKGQPHQSKAKREYEYVHIADLYASMQDVFSSIALEHSKKSPFDKSSALTEGRHYMKLLAILIGLSGTDFTRSLPHISPPTMWSMVCKDKSVTDALFACFKQDSGQLDIEAACNLLISRMYCIKFATHVKNVSQQHRSSLASILSLLKVSLKICLSLFEPSLNYQHGAGRKQEQALRANKAAASKPCKG